MLESDYILNRKLRQSKTKNEVFFLLHGICVFLLECQNATYFAEEKELIKFSLQILPPIFHLSD